MAWDLPSNPIAGTIATVVAWGQKVRDCLEYIKGLAGPVTIEDDLTVQGDIAVTGTVDGRDVAADGTTLDSHGPANHTNREREIFISAEEMYTTLARGQTFNRPIITFPDAADNYAYGWLRLPTDYVAFVSVKAEWLCLGAGVADLYWQTGIYWCGAGDLGNDDSDLPALGVTTSGGAGIHNIEEPANPIAGITMSVGDSVGIHFRRDGINVLDTLNADMQLVGVILRYISDE